MTTSVICPQNRHSPCLFMKNHSHFKSEDTRFWCEYCRIFVYNNRINREKHENSPQHQANFKKKIENIRKDESASLSSTAKHKSFSNSFYDNSHKGSVPIEESSPVNILTIKPSNSLKIVKKPLLGLPTNTSAPPSSGPSKANNIDLSPTGTERNCKQTCQINAASIKNYVSELKRKSGGDEKNTFILSHYDSYNEPSLNEETPDSSKIGSMFKKKKK